MYFPFIYLFKLIFMGVRLGEQAWGWRLGKVEAGEVSVAQIALIYVEPRAFF